MAYENLCMYCFEELGGRAVCPHCGKDANAAVPQIQLLPGTMVYHDRFLVGRALGQDATGIVYSAFDTKRENKLRIREYLPRDCAERLNDGGVVPIAGMEDRFDAGLRKLRASVEEVEDPRKRHFFFEENGTGYIVQRKNPPTAAEAAPRDEGPEDDGGRRRIIIIAVIAALVVVAAAVALIMMFNGSLNPTKDVTGDPTLDPNQVWIPAETPTPTPYASPTFAALVDPDLSWMDYTFTGNTGNTSSNTGTGTASGSYNNNYTATATPRPTAAPTLSGDASGYKNINSKSSTSQIKALQQKLVTLGWLDYSKASGKYDAATRQAVKDFQTYINENYNPATRLTVDGIAGPKTQQWLYQTNATRPTPTPKPTATPRPAVTAAPSDDTVIDENSGSKAISAMQRKLAVLGVMPSGSDNGKFDATTRAAVKRFQARVNELQGYTVLETTGKMDALSMAFLDYYIDEWIKLQTATVNPTGSAVTPTPTATAKPTTNPGSGTINAASSKADIQALQRRLIALGLLAEGSDDGVYGSTTSKAVYGFQQWVNQQRNESTLTINGEADQLTQAYLKYCEDNGLKPNPVQIPTQAPSQTEEPDEEPNEQVDVTIDKNSDKASIRRVQELLADVGLMSPKGVDGVYGSGTSKAVRAFQEWVNAHDGMLEVTGVVDNATREALEYYSDHGLSAVATPTPTATLEPTPEPTEEPTEEPEDIPDDEITEAVDISIGADSDPESIRFVQQMLSQIGALDEGGITGVYDSATSQAVVAFQQWFNRQGITRLDVTGQIDNGTRQMLEYCFDHDLRMEAADLATDTPTQDPNDPFNEPDEDEDSGTFEPSVSQLDIAIGGGNANGATVEITDSKFAVSWKAEGSVNSYYVYVTDSAGNSIISREAIKDTGFNVDASRMNPGEVYTVTVGALPVGGTQDDMVWQSARFTRPAPVTPEPTEVPTPSPEPEVGAVNAPEISVNGTSAVGETVMIQGDSFQIGWSASGDVQGYNVQISDANGNLITSQASTRQTAISVKSSQLQPGFVYTIAVGAIPVNGGDEDIIWSRGQFMVPQAATPEPTEVPTPVPTEEPTPVPTVANIGKPSVTVGGSAYQEDGISYMTDSTIIVSWGAEGDVQGYIVYMENQSGERQSLGTTTDTSRTVSTGSLPSGIYTVHVGAVPVNGTQDDAQWGTATFGIPAPTPEPTDEPTPVPETAVPELEQGYTDPIDGSTDSGTVEKLQMRLYRLGVMAGEPEQGVLDKVTLQAVAEFQSRANAQYNAGLDVVDPSDPGATVDVSTLKWIVRGL